MSVRTGQAGGLRFLHQRSPQWGAAAPLCGAARSAASSGGGISALRLVRSVRPCAMLAKSVFVLKTKVLCPAAASGGFVRPKNWSRSEVGQKSRNLESSQNGLASVDFRRVFLGYLEAPNSILVKNLKINRILLNLSIFSLSPCLGSLGLLSLSNLARPRPSHGQPIPRPWPGHMGLVPKTRS